MKSQMFLALAVFGCSRLHLPLGACAAVHAGEQACRLRLQGAGADPAWKSDGVSRGRSQVLCHRRFPDTGRRLALGGRWL